MLHVGADKSLQAQIFDQVRTLILDGRLQAGMSLPPTRLVAERYQISRNTVMIAYDRLAAEGYIESRGTSGLFVTSIPPDDLLLVSSPRSPLRSNGPVPAQSGEPLLCFAGSPGGGEDRPTIDFWVGRSAASGFPLRVWRRIVTKLLSGDSQYLTDYSDPAGLAQLRKAIADHLGRTRGMHVTTDQIIVTSGAQDALNLVMNLLRGHTEHLCIENPCYAGASMIFQGEKLSIDPIPVDSDGIRTDCLPGKQRSLIYVTPSHQYPTGVVMTLSRRLALLRWADDTDSYIMEDDYDSDFRYDGPPLTALSGLDRGRRVFYIGSFSKSVGAGLRLGFAVVPPIFSDDARLLKAKMSNGQSWLEQCALAEFVSEGHFDRHIRKLRQLYKSRRDALISALRKRFREPVISGQESGLHLVWRLPKGMPSALAIQTKARAAGVGVYALSSGGAFDFDGTAPDDMLMFGYASLTESSIVEAVEKLDGILRAMNSSRPQDR
jgi:GntR family transcriptional regulator/MocR family aminotransferase